MGARSSSGFTIIETMLFLAITGLLIMGVLVGTGTALNTQRYRDAVETFKNTLQEQYSSLGSVRNDRANTWTCDAQARPLPEGQEIRGQSECMLVGRYLRIQESNVEIYTVLAREIAGSPERSTDIQTISQNYAYNVTTEDTVKTTLEWGTKIAWPQSGAGSEHTGARSIGLLFVRSPESGNVYTFSSDDVPADAVSIQSSTLTDMMIEAATIPGRGQRTVCVQSGGMFAGGDMAVSIGQFAAGTSAIEVRSNDFMKATMGGSAPQC